MSSVLKAAFKSIKSEGYVVPALNTYLLSLNSKDSDRALNVNAPSSIGKCPRSIYYSRVQPADGISTIEPRTRRIFDNGHHVHIRLQDYLKAQGILLVDEVPVFNQSHNIQGHTDGVLKLSDKEFGILEIKSINSHGYSQLKEPKPEHVKQGLIYVYCLEERRKFLRKKYPTLQSFKSSLLARKKFYKSLYPHFRDGHRYTREEKLAFQVSLHTQIDSILYSSLEPITKAIFLYENKDTQDLKEFVIDSMAPGNKLLTTEIITTCDYINECVNCGKPPERGPEHTSASCYDCRFCDYKIECWG